MNNNYSDPNERFLVRLAANKYETLMNTTCGGRALLISIGFKVKIAKPSSLFDELSYWYEGYCTRDEVEAIENWFDTVYC